LKSHENEIGKLHRVGYRDLFSLFVGKRGHPITGRITRIADTDHAQGGDGKSPQKNQTMNTPRTEAVLAECYKRFDSIPNELIVLCEEMEREVAALKAAPCDHCRQTPLTENEWEYLKKHGDESPTQDTPYRDSDGYDHDCIRCDEMADIDCDTKYPGERGTCCVCAGHDCEEARAERAKHPICENAGILAHADEKTL
jgi:hypothetical protein